MGYNDPAARGILGLMYARVPPKLSEDCRLHSSRSPRTVKWKEETAHAHGDEYEKDVIGRKASDFIDVHST